jgi:hypothetical protein
VRSQTSYAGLRLALGGRGAVCRASALPLAGILPPVRLVAAALAFAIVLSLAGVLGKLLLRGNHHTGDCRGACGCLRLAGTGLGVEARGRAAEEAGESGGQSEVAYCSGFHEEFLFSVGPGGVPGS